MGVAARVLVCAWSLAGCEGRSPTAPTAAGEDAFAVGRVWAFELDLTPAAAAQLRREPRQYVRATVREGTNVFAAVGVHLKGATGSFRPLDDKPSFTLDFDRFTQGQRFHGLDKLHLNNSVEDPSLLNERLGSELFQAAGLPATRASHARVRLNGRRLGLYVLKEGFTREFLARHFRNPVGTLYEPKNGSDVDGRMERDLGSGPDEPADLAALAAAAREPDPVRRAERLQTVLDLDRFLSFMALEVLLGHRDGYCLARNNFRVYHDADTGRLVFLPHGMDVLLGNPRLPLQPQMAGLVARAVMDTPECRQRYRERLGLLFTNLFKVDALTRRVDQIVAPLRSALSASEARALTKEAQGLRQRIAARAAGIAQQLAEPEPQPLPFDGDVARLGPWRAVDIPPGGTLDQRPAPDGRPALHIQAGPVTAASWRAKARLGPGRYRFEGQARLAQVAPLPYGRNQGAGLRIAGRPQPQPGHFTGDAPWTALAVEFEVRGLIEEVECVCELRARAGDAWFDLDSLRLVRLR